ncbi:MAG: hypothetical protein ACK5HR_04515 [Mycoplasmatales bacterium]
MKKILGLIFTIFILCSVIIVYNINYQEVSKFKNVNLSEEYIHVKLNNLNNNEYDLIYNLILQNNISYYYIDTQKDSLLVNEYTIKTNLEKVFIGEQGYNLDKSCLSFGTLNNDCQKFKKINKNKYLLQKTTENELNDGSYYFFKGNLTEFGEKLSLLNSKVVKENIWKYYLFNYILLGLIIINIIFIFMIVFKKALKEKKRRNLILLSGYSLNKIIINESKNLSNVIGGVTVIYILLIFIISKFWGIKIEDILLIFIILLIFDILLIILYSIFILITTSQDIGEVIKKQVTYVKLQKFLNFFKISLLIIFTLILTLAVNIFTINYHSYHNLNQALNIRNDFGQFQGTNIGNDTEEYFTSQKYHDLENKASAEILNNVDFFLSYLAEYSPAENNDNNQDIYIIDTVAKYLDYNNIIDINGKKIKSEQLATDTCYYLIPEKYTEIDLLGNCEKEKIIQIENNQQLPSYDYLAKLDTYGVVTNPIIIIYSKEDSKNVATYDNIYYPINKDGTMVNEEYVTNVLKKYGIYDNTNKFYTINEDVKYSFLGIVAILEALTIFILILLLNLYFVLKFVVTIYFEENSTKIALYTLEGYNIIKIYSELLKKLVKDFIFEFIVIELLCLILHINLILSVIIIIFTYLIVLIITIINIKKIEKSKLNNILKGVDYD